MTKKIKVTLVIGAFAFIVCVVIGSYFMKIDNNNADGNLLEIAIYPAGTSSETYLFSLRPENILEVSIGERRYGTDIRSDRFMKQTELVEQKKISQQQFNDLVESVNKVKKQSHHDTKKIVKDG
ncbi:hypothetical protein [Paenibacillus sp. NEAU-GSW1]|uniref:hypothetical protein n=1 Tax=Paenibacillus sp. NEAU-GSW1 TaxID=2682486 RepID=UPI0012E13DBB|nr:hypothetical protein [Paenibacillus sp. NEAU-GSW1]MUT67481.1 hypothetical protein [Paenibacillus sp. NEAU-GSW1]